MLRFNIFRQRATMKIVIFTDSVLSRIRIKGADRFTYRKRRLNGEYVEEWIGYSHTIYVPQQKVTHFAISGWFMCDGIPAIVQKQLLGLQDISTNDNITFLLSVGINDLR